LGEKILMEIQVPFENEYLFGNTFLEFIPHPTNWIGDVLDLLTIVCHYLGGITFFVILLPILYLFYDRRFASYLAYAVFSVGIINGLLKYFFMSPRPSNLSEKFISISSHVREYSFGLPSGHSHVSILVWGLFFFHFKNFFIRLISLFFIILTPFSRMYAGVHYPGDVILGFFCGLISLLIMLKYKQQILHFPSPSQWSKPLQKIKTFSLLILALTLLFTLLELNPYNTFTHLQSLSSVISAAGAFSGFLIGLFFLNYKYPNLPQHIKKEDRWLGILLLVLGILFFYFGMSYIFKNIFPDNGLFRYMRYFVLNFYFSFFVYFFIQNKKKTTNA